MTRLELADACAKGCYDIGGYPFVAKYLMEASKKLKSDEKLIRKLVAEIEKLKEQCKR